jgi:predicted RNase H-like nuclease
MMSKKVKIVGIDPAPVSDSYVFDPDGVLNWPKGRIEASEIGADSRVIRAKPNQLIAAIKDLGARGDEKVLVCWDAPLTGFVWSDAVSFPEKALYTRKIEQHFQEQKLPKGISTLGYAAAAHWTISQVALGYPRMQEQSKFSSEPPVRLITCANGKTANMMCSPHLVEVHPAVAMYSWLKDETFVDTKNTSYSGADVSWKYKPKTKAETDKPYRVTPDDCYGKLLGKFPRLLENFNLTAPLSAAPKKCEDGPLDAIVAWLLGAIWLEEAEEVKLMGDRHTGAWLVPEAAWKSITEIKVS